MNKTKIIVVEDNIVYCEYVCNMLSREKPMSSTVSSGAIPISV